MAVGIWASLATVVSFGVYRTWFSSGPEGGSGDAGEEAVAEPGQLTGTLAPQRGVLVADGANDETEDSRGIVLVQLADGISGTVFVDVGRAVGQVADRLAAEGVTATVAFGPAAWAAVSPHEAKGCEDFELEARGALPATGGDVLVHIRGDSGEACAAALKEVEAAVTGAAAGKCSVTALQGCRAEWDGIMRGAIAVSTERAREIAAVDASTGGSYALLQTWENDMQAVSGTPAEALAEMVGVTASGEQLGTAAVEGGVAAAVEAGLPATSHAARCNVDASSGGVMALARHHVPYTATGGVAAGSGTAVVTYGSHPAKLKHLVDRIAGVGDTFVAVNPEHYSAPTTEEGGELLLPDGVLQVAKCSRGAMFYVPSVVQMRGVASSE